MKKIVLFLFASFFIFAVVNAAPPDIDIGVDQQELAIATKQIAVINLVDHAPGHVDYITIYAELPKMDLLWFPKVGMNINTNYRIQKNCFIKLDASQINIRKKFHRISFT